MKDFSSSPVKAHRNCFKSHKIALNHIEITLTDEIFPVNTHTETKDIL